VWTIIPTPFEHFIAMGGYNVESFAAFVQSLKDQPMTCLKPLLDGCGTGVWNGDIEEFASRFTQDEHKPVALSDNEHVHVSHPIEGFQKPVPILNMTP
jgi:hypothetical protein